MLADPVAISAMMHRGAIIFGDLAGKLPTLRVTCNECGRAGRYRLCRLIDDRGCDARIVDFLDIRVKNDIKSEVKPPRLIRTTDTTTDRD